MLKEWIINFVNLPIQYSLLVASFYLLIAKEPSCKKILKSIFWIFIPASIIYQYKFWLGILYLMIGLVVYFSFFEKRRILYWAIILIVAIISDHLATTIIYSIPIQSESLRFLFRIFLFIVLHSTAIYLISLLKERFKFEIPIKIYWIITWLVLITLGVFYFNIFRIYNHSSIEEIKVNTIFLLSYFILVLILIGFIIHINLKSYMIKAKEKEYKNFTEYIQSVEQVNKDMQKFRHDYLNILLGMKGYIEAKDLKGLEEYFNEGILKFELKTLDSNKILGNLNNIQDLSLKGLLFNKASNAIEKDLVITIEVPYPFNVTSDLINLTRILGILIDNAIENCIEDNKKVIQIAIVQQNNSALFIIRNEIKNKNIKVNKLFEEGYTTKTYGQGLGLATVKKILDASSNLSLNVWVEDCWFNAELFLKERKNASSNL